MTTALLIFLVLLDAALIVSIVFLNKKQETHSDLLVDLTEERRLLNELKENIRNELRSAQKQNKEAIAKVSHIAAEAEQEVKNSGNSLASGIEEVFNEISHRFEKPLSELAKRQAAIDNMSKKLVLERERLLKVVSRGEAIVRFFDEKTPFEDVLKDLEVKKYEDCKHLLAKGITEDQIASELGMSRSEIKLIAGMA